MTSPSERQLRRDIVCTCKRLYEHGWIASTDGNVSVRLQDNLVLTTPTGIHKGLMSAGDLVVVDLLGNPIRGNRQVSSEFRMHAAAYEMRPDVGAVVHAHPTFCVAFSLAGISLAECMLPEVALSLGSIPTTEYATPTTAEVPREVKRWLKHFDAMILSRHGSLTVGNSLLDACNKLERMEHAAEITFYARMLGNVTALTKPQLSKLAGICPPRAKLALERSSKLTARRKPAQAPSGK